MRFTVFESDFFVKKVLKSLNKQELYRYELCKEKIASGQMLGKPLKSFFFRELKFGGKRIYFLVYQELHLVLFVNCSNKKYQQETIEEILLLLPRFNKLAHSLAKK